MQPANSKLIATLLLAATLLFACDAVDTVREGFAHSEAVSTELEKSLGVKSFIGFNWNNKVLNSVTVTFQGIPTDHPLPEIAEIARKAVINEFKQEPKQISIAFVVAP